MDIGKAFGFVFEDEEWVSKVLIGGLIFLIPLIGQFAVIGYSFKVAQNVMPMTILRHTAVLRPWAAPGYPLLPCPDRARLSPRAGLAHPARAPAPTRSLAARP